METVGKLFRWKSFPPAIAGFKHLHEMEYKRRKPGNDSSTDSATWSMSNNAAWRWVGSLDAGWRGKMVEGSVQWDLLRSFQKNFQIRLCLCSTGGSIRSQWFCSVVETDQYVADSDDELLHSTVVSDESIIFLMLYHPYVWRHLVLHFDSTPPTPPKKKNK